MGFFGDLTARLRAGDALHTATAIAAGLKIHDLLTEETVLEPVTTSRLYIGNLSFDATEDDLRKFFAECGKVVSAEISRHPHTARSKGFGFVTMATKRQAKRAASQKQDVIFMSRKMVVGGAEARIEEGEKAG